MAIVVGKGCRSHFTPGAGVEHKFSPWFRDKGEKEETRACKTSLGIPSYGLHLGDGWPKGSRRIVSCAPFLCTRACLSSALQSAQWPKMDEAKVEGRPTAGSSFSG